MALLKRLVIGVAIVGFAAAASAGDLEDGIAAFEAKNFGVASSKLVPLAGKGVPEAQFYLAQMHYFGNGVRGDFTKAFDLMQASADHGYVPAQVGIVAYMWVMYGLNVGNIQSRFTPDEFKKEYWKRMKIALSVSKCKDQWELRTLAQQFVETNREYEKEWQQLQALGCKPASAGRPTSMLATSHMVGKEEESY